MGSFNLGRVKGDKGDRGEMGPKGDTGAKGEKGDRGDNGRDGLTPVFTIGGTATLDPGEKAYVEIDTQNPATPVLYFRIPAGFDGKDSMGDMLSTVYDPEGVKGDVYKYARDLFETCVKVSGGTLGGALKATESSILEGTVRNISARNTLPENGTEGDICIITADENSKTLEECQEGDIFLIEEAGVEEPYIVVAKNHHEKNSVTLLRKNLTTGKGRYNISKRSSYSMSEADMFLECIFKFQFTEFFRKNMVSTEVETNVYRQCFLPDKSDFTGMNYFANESNRTAKNPKINSNEEYFTRSLDSRGSVITINSTGGFSSLAQTETSRYRPTIVLPSDLRVVNTVYEEKPAIKLYETKPGLYMYMQGQWKECVCL